MMISVITLTCAVLAFEPGMTAMLLDVLYSHRREVNFRALACLLLFSHVGVQSPKRRGRIGHFTGIPIHDRTPESNQRAEVASH